MSRNSTAVLPTDKLPLPAFLKMLSTGSGCTMQQAIAVAGKLYKTHSTPEQLGSLSTLTLESMGFNANDCKLIMTAISKAGYIPKAQGKASASTSTTTSAPRKKRKRDSDLDAPLPSTSSGVRIEPTVDLTFEEELDEEVLKTRSTVTNRAPVMSAWAMVVCERLGFQRTEALSIGSAYTEMNAITKGVSIGVFDSSKGKGVELAKDDSQPYVDIMGRRIPVMKTLDDTWRALVKSEPVDPADAHGYIKRSFRQTTPHVLGAMRLLARTFTPTELNEKGYGLYAEFRPPAGQWGSRSEMKLSSILALRKEAPSLEAVDATPVIRHPEPAAPVVPQTGLSNVSGASQGEEAEPSAKRSKMEDSI